MGAALAEACPETPGVACEEVGAWLMGWGGYILVYLVWRIYRRGSYPKPQRPQTDLTGIGWVICGFILIWPGIFMVILFGSVVFFGAFAWTWLVGVIVITIWGLVESRKRKHGK